MKKAKPNISLSNLSELRSSGALLALRKGINELFNRRKNAGLLPYPEKEDSVYQPIISVIICTANPQEMSQKTAESILKEDFDRLEVIIVNNSGKNFDTEKLFGKVRYIDEPKQGLSFARNCGAAAANGEYLLYIDDDAIARGGLLNAVFSAFENHPDYAIVGGQIFLRVPEPKPEILLSGREALWSAYTVPYRHFKEVREQYEFPYGACFAIRHSVLDEIGGFPLSYGRCGNDYAGGEETAVCFSVKKRGYKIGVEPSAQVMHCVDESRFSPEHVRKTIRESIITTYRLFKDGYAESGWTTRYVKERLGIINHEILRLSGVEAFYKQCEYDAFCELSEIMKQNSE